MHANNQKLGMSLLSKLIFFGSSFCALSPMHVLEHLPDVLIRWAERKRCWAGTCFFIFQFFEKKSLCATAKLKHIVPQSTGSDG